MIGIYVSVPVACFRKGIAREYLETEMIPPPSTCYGFLLSLVGETDRKQHVGVRVTAALISSPATSVVLRTVWRVKNRPLGSAGNTRPDYQQLLSDVRLVIWIDSTAERQDATSLERRVRYALSKEHRDKINRFGGLSLGESTHLVDEVSLFEESLEEADCFVLNEQGRMILPVWVDHVGSVGTVYVTGNLERRPLTLPKVTEIPMIQS